VEKGKRIHTIVAVVSVNVDQTIVGCKDLMAMGIISPDWPAMPRQETEGRILAADEDEEEKELAPLTLRRSARVQERKERESATVNAILSFTSEDWMRDSDTWNEEKRIIDVVSDDDKMESYYFEGKKLYMDPTKTSQED
jgi:hypothetical protein